ncbi:hypothetical protein Tco_1082397 [Tanacetum coccineum]|uniref:Uncharacterized protein n=1 Tax=Tanacetum coccineum TaxID=301880 RepID=A0ABQ5I1Z1_9ASTR
MGITIAAHFRFPAPKPAMHGQQRIQLSPATNVNITTTFSGMSYQTVDWGCYLLFQVETKFEFFTLIEIVLFGTCNTLFEDVKADDPDVLLGVGVESDVNVSFRGLPLGLGVNDIVLFCTCKPASGDVEIDGLCASLCAVLECLSIFDHLTTTGITAIPGERRSIEELEGMSWQLTILRLVFM